MLGSSSSKNKKEKVDWIITVGVDDIRPSLYVKNSEFCVYLKFY